MASRRKGLNWHKAMAGNYVARDPYGLAYLVYRGAPSWSGGCHWYGVLLSPYGGMYAAFEGKTKAEVVLELEEQGRAIQRG